MRRIAAACALVVGIVGVGLLTGCGGPSNVVGTYKGNKGGPQTYVTLETQPDGSCKATEGVGVLGGKSKAKLTWHLTNNCTSTQYLAVTHYQEYLDPKDPTKLGPVDPDVVDPDPALDKLDPRDADKTLDAHIKKDHKDTADNLYKYWICVSTTAIPNPVPDPPPSSIKCLDPDVDVWP